MQYHVRFSGVGPWVRGEAVSGEELALAGVDSTRVAALVAMGALGELGDVTVCTASTVSVDEGDGVFVDLTPDLSGDVSGDLRAPKTDMSAPITAPIPLEDLTWSELRRRAKEVGINPLGRTRVTIEQLIREAERAHATAEQGE